MSGGGSTPNAPDLSGNVNAANQTFGTATSNANQTYNTALGYNNNAQRNLAQATGLTNDQSNQIAQNATKNLQSYQQNFIPLQQAQAEGAQKWGSEENIARMQGQAVANTNAGAQAARQNAAAALAAEGVDPASARGAALDRTAAVQAGAAAAGAGTNAAINTQLQAQGLENQANQLGLGVNQAGTTGGATAAQVAQAGQQGINTTNASAVNNMTAANQYLNTGINANKSASDIANTQFQDQMAVYNAQQQQQAGVGQLAGDVAGVAMMAMMEEGGAVPPGMTPPDMGIPVYSNAPGGMHNFAAGGMVMERGSLPRSPIPGSTDRKPALLTPGEFVIPKDVVDFAGQDHFHKLIDSLRNKANQRRAIPVHRPPHVAMT